MKKQTEVDVDWGKMAAELTKQGYDSNQVAEAIARMKKEKIVAEVEEPCSHQELECLREATYQCKNCQRVVRIITAEMYTAEGFFNEHLRLLSKVKGVEKWQKEMLTKKARKL